MRNPGLPALVSRRARVIRGSPRGDREMTPSSAALARQRRPPRGGHQQRTFERRSRRGRGADDASVRMRPGGSPRWQSASDASASDPRDFAPTTARSLERGGYPSDRVPPGQPGPRARGKQNGTERPLIDLRGIAGNKDGRDVEATAGRDGKRATQGVVTSGPNARTDTKATSEGRDPGRTGRRAPEYGAQRYRLSAEQGLGGPVPRRYDRDDDAGNGVAATTAIDGERKSGEAKVSGDAHRLQGRRVLQGDEIGAGKAPLR